MRAEFQASNVGIESLRRIERFVGEIRQVDVAINFEQVKAIWHKHRLSAAKFDGCAEHSANLSAAQVGERARQAVQGRMAVDVAAELWVGN